MIKNGEYSGFDDKELISDWADAHLWGRPNPNSEYWKFRKGIETGGMETAKEIGDKYRNEYYKDDSEDELWHAHDANDKKDFERLSSPMSESQFREIVSKVIRESLEELGGEDDFQPNGYKGMNNYGGNEIQVNRNGDSARIRFQDGEVTDWLEIEFDEEGVAYVTTPYGEQEKLSDYMRY